MGKLTQIAFDFDLPPASPEPVKAPPAPKKQPAAPAPVVVALPEQKKPKSTRGRKSLKEMSASAAQVAVPDDEVLFQKMYYPIGQVAAWFKVNPSLIRLWENEFDVLKPKKNGKGDRLFRPEDVKNLQLIFHLTREKKYTLEGAKDYFRNQKNAEEKSAAIDSLKKLRAFLLEMKANL